MEIEERRRTTKKEKVPSHPQSLASFCCLPGSGPCRRDDATGSGPALLPPSPDASVNKLKKKIKIIEYLLDEDKIIEFFYEGRKGAWPARKSSLSRKKIQDLEPCFGSCFGCIYKNGSCGMIIAETSQPHELKSLQRIIESLLDKQDRKYILR